MATQQGFTQQLDTPQNDEQDRRGTPPVDNTPIYNDIESAAKATGNVFDSIDKAQNKAIENSASTGVQTYIQDPIVQQLQNHPDVQSLSNVAAGVSQNPDNQASLAIKTQAVSKQLKFMYPGYEAEVDQAVNKAIGATSTQSLIGAALKPQLDQQAFLKAGVDESIRTGQAVIKDDGTVDEHASFMNYQKYQATQASMQATTAAYNQGKIEAERKDNTLQQGFLQSIPSQKTNALTNLVNSPQWQQIKQMPAASQDSAVANLTSQFLANTDLQATKDIAASGMSYAKQNETLNMLKEQDEFFKSNIAPKVTQVETAKNNAEWLKANGVADGAQMSKTAFNLTQALGSSASIFTQEALQGSTVPAKIQTEITAAQGALGTNPLQSKTNAERAIDSSNFMINAANNLNTLAAHVSMGNTQFIGPTVAVNRNLSVNSNQLTPQEDKTSNLLKQNLANLALSQPLDNGNLTGINSSNYTKQDLINNVKEITQPLNVNAIKQSQAKQYNPQLADQTANMTFNAAAKGVSNVRDDIDNAIADDRVTVDRYTGRLIVNPVPFQSPQDMMSKDPGNPNLQLGASNAQQLINDQKQQYLEDSKFVNFHNQAVDAMVKLKTGTPYEGVNDNKLRDLLNQKYHPQLYAPIEDLGGGRGPEGSAKPNVTSGGYSSNAMNHEGESTITAISPSSSPTPIQSPEDNTVPAGGY